MQKYLLPFIIAILLTGIFLNDYLLSGQPNTIPATYPDAWEFLWTISRTLSELPHYYFTKLLFYPEGSSLHFHTTAEGLTLPAAIILKFLNPQQIFGTLVLVIFILNYISGYFLFLKLSQNKIVASFLATILTFNPWMLARLDAGHLNFIALFPLILISYFILEVLDNNKLKPKIFLALSIASLVFINLYFLYFFILISISLGLYFYRDYLKLTRLILPFLAGFLVWVPKAIFILLNSRAFTPNHLPENHSADLLSLLVPNTYQAISGFFTQPNLVANLAENAVYPGFFLILLAIYCSNLKYKTNQGLAFTSLLFFVLSLGPILQVNGASYFSYLPYKLLSKLPFFPSVPARFAWIGSCLLFILVARNFNTSKNFQKIILVLCFLELLPYPAKTSRLPEFNALANISTATAFIDTGDSQASMLRQIIHQKPVVGGFLSRRPKKVLNNYRKNKFLRYLYRGEENSLPERIHDFNSLKANCLIVENSASKIKVQVEKLGWFQSMAKDELIEVYCKTK